MQSHPVDAPLRGFRRMVFAIADHRVAEGRKLHPNLVLQSRDERDQDERSGT